MWHATPLSYYTHNHYAFIVELCFLFSSVSRPAEEAVHGGNVLDCYGCWLYELIAHSYESIQYSFIALPFAPDSKSCLKLSFFVFITVFLFRVSAICTLKLIWTAFISKLDSGKPSVFLMFHRKLYLNPSTGHFTFRSA